MGMKILTSIKKKRYTSKHKNKKFTLKRLPSLKININKKLRQKFKSKKNKRGGSLLSDIMGNSGELQPQPHNTTTPDNTPMSNNEFEPPKENDEMGEAYINDTNKKLDVENDAMYRSAILEKIANNMEGTVENKKKINSKNLKINEILCKTISEKGKTENLSTDGGYIACVFYIGEAEYPNYNIVFRIGKKLYYDYVRPDNLDGINKDSNVTIEGRTYTYTIEVSPVKELYDKTQQPITEQLPEQPFVEQPFVEQQPEQQITEQQPEQYV